MDGKQQVRVLFVCMGNICRSPTAHGVFRDLVRKEGLQERIEIDSAGTHAYHVGNEPDQRAQATAQARGIDLSDLRARQVTADDFIDYDYILAMDEENHDILRALCPRGEEGRLRLFLEFAPGQGVREVPDPYYGGAQGFERVFDLVDAASRGLLKDIERNRIK